MTLWDEIRADLAACGGSARVAAMTSRGFHALLCYRLAHRAFQRGHVLAALALTRLVQFAYAIDIDYRARIEGGVRIQHGVGVVIGSGAQVGAGTALYQGVTMGTGRKGEGHPVVGRDVVCGAGAVLLGPVKVGDGARIGANTVVVDDVPAGATVVGNPGQVIEQ